MFRYLLNILWVVLGQPHRVVRPYRPSLLIECHGFCRAIYVNRKRREARAFYKKPVVKFSWPTESHKKKYGSNYALEA